MTWVMLVVLAATAITAFRRGNDLLSPSRIYLCVYAFLLSLYYLRLSQLQTPWAVTTNLLFYGASGLFLVAGAWMLLMARIKRPDWTLDFASIKDSLRLDASGIDWRWFGQVYAFCALIFLASFGVSLAIVGGLPAFMPEPDEARLKFFTANILSNYGIFMGPISLMLGMVQIWFSNPGPQVKRRIYLSMGLVFLLYMTIVTRYDLFRFLIFSVVLYHYGRNRLRPVHLAAGLGLAATVFFTGFLIRVNTATFETFNELIKVKMPPQLAWAANIYAYLANDFWNFDFAIRRFVEGDETYPLQYGMGLFRALLWNLRLEPGLVQAFRFDSLMNERATRIDGLNTVIYVWHFYKDFGIAGAMLLPMLGGLFAWKFYLNSMMRPSVFRISMWGIFAGTIALSYHSPLWELWFLYLNILVLLVAHRKVKVA